MGLGMLLHMENLEEPRKPRRGAPVRPYIWRRGKLR